MKFLLVFFVFFFKNWVWVSAALKTWKKNICGSKQINPLAHWSFQRSTSCEFHAFYTWHSEEKLLDGWATPLKNMSSSVGMMTFPIWWKKIKNLWNHQPENHPKLGIDMLPLPIFHAWRIPGRLTLQWDFSERPFNTRKTRGTTAGLRQEKIETKINMDKYG